MYIKVQNIIMGAYLPDLWTQQAHSTSIMSSLCEPHSLHAPQRDVELTYTCR